MNNTHVNVEYIPVETEVDGGSGGMPAEETEDVTDCGGIYLLV